MSNNFVKYYFLAVIMANIITTTAYSVRGSSKTSTMNFANIIKENEKNDYYDKMVQALAEFLKLRKNNITKEEKNAVKKARKEIKKHAV